MSDLSVRKTSRARVLERLRELKQMEKTSAAGAIGAGLLAAGLAGPRIAESRATSDFKKRFAEAARNAPNFRNRFKIREALGAGEVPHMKLTEMLGEEAAKASPMLSAYYAPTKENLPYIQTVMSYKPEFAEFAKKRGLVLSSGNLPASEFAHEMGHATGLGESPTYRAIINKLYGSGKHSSKAGAVLGVLAGLLTKKPKLSALAGGGLAAVMNVPKVFEETRANMRAREALKSLGIEPEQTSSYLSHLSPAIGATAVGAGGSLLASALKKVLTTAKKAGIKRMTKSGSPLAEGDYMLRLLAQMRQNPALADEIYAAGMSEKAKYVPQLAEQAALQSQAASSYAPTTLSGGLTDVASFPAVGVGLSGLGGAYRTARGLLGGAKGPGALASMWKAVQPRALAKSTIRPFQPGWMGMSAGIEGAMGTLQAMQDPEYVAGKIPLWRAMLKQTGRMGQSSQISMAKTMDAPYGTLKGLALSPMQGLASPIGTVAGFGQALGRLGRTILGKEADVKLLEPIIKQAIAEAGGEGSTLADLAKAANVPDFDFGDPKVPEFMQPQNMSIRNWLVSKLLGMPQTDVDNLRAALGGVSRVAGLFQRAPSLQEQPEFDISPLVDLRTR